MNDLLRTFIAIKITPQPELAKIINTLQQELRGEAIKWVELNNMHITVKFLGDTSCGQADQVITALSDVAARFPVFSFDLNGVSFFQKGSQPRVLFVKTGSSEMLNKLAEEIENDLLSLGYAKESRGFSPHLTIGRIKYLKERSAFKRVIEKFRQYHLQNELCRQIIFYQSLLKPQGPVYKPLAELKFNEGH
jgi:2'-5' RNA ligase